METVTFPGNLRVNGDLVVAGNPPQLSRDRLIQEPLAIYPVLFDRLRFWDALHTLLPGTPANDDLGIITGTLATDAPTIQTGDLKAAGATTRYLGFLDRLPVEYDETKTVQYRIRAGMLTTVADVSATLDVEVYKFDGNGLTGTDICTTSAADINDLTIAAFDFTVNPASLAPGDQLLVRVGIAVNDGATATAVIGLISSIALLADIKG